MKAALPTPLAPTSTVSTAATASASSTTTTTTTTAGPSSATTAATATASIALGASLINLHRSTLEILPVKALDRRLGFFVCRHLDEAEAP